MNAERDRVATQLFLWRGQFRSTAPTFATERLDALDGDGGPTLRMINHLAATAARIGEREETLRAADRQMLADLHWLRDKLESAAAAGGVPPTWIDYARHAGERRQRLDPQELLSAPWVDHRSRLARSIGADVERLTTMASACAVRAHRNGHARALEDVAEATQLQPNMRAIWTRAARTADAIGADAEECRRLWRVEPEQWQATVSVHLSSDPDVFDRWWSVYTDPDIAVHVDAFVKKLPLYAALTSQTGTPPGTSTGFPPPNPSEWLAAASSVLNSALDPSCADIATTYDVVVETVDDAAAEWEPPPGIPPSNSNDLGSSPGD